jgi:hypothetical protein
MRDFDFIPNPEGIEFRRLFAPDANPEVIIDTARQSFQPRSGFNSTPTGVGLFKGFCFSALFRSESYRDYT